MLSIMNASSRFLLAWRASTQKSLCLTHWFHIGIYSGKLLFCFGVLVEAVMTYDGEITRKCDLDWRSYWLTSQRCLPWIACQGNGGDEMVRGSLSGHQRVLGKCKRSKQQCFQWVLLVCSWGVWLHKDYRNLSVPAALRKSCRLLQNKAFFTTCHGLSVKCLPLAPVSNVSHRLLALNTWSQQATLSGKMADSLGGEILLKEVVTEGGPWSFMVEPHFLLKCKLCFCLWMPRDHIASCNCCRAFPACGYAFSTMIDFIPSEPWAQINPFSLTLPLSGYVIIAKGK